MVCVWCKFKEGKRWCKVDRLIKGRGTGCHRTNDWIQKKKTTKSYVIRREKKIAIKTKKCERKVKNVCPKQRPET